MTKKSTKAIAGLLIAAACCAFTGCQTEDKKETVTLVERPETETIIHMFSSGGAFSSTNQAKYWSEHFAEMTGIHAAIDYEESWYYAEGGSDGRDGRTILRTRLASDQPDDMYIVNAEDMVDFARRGYLLDMSDFDFVANLSDAALQLSTIDGKVYCLPLSYTGFGLYWNMDLLEQYHLSLPRNYDELITLWDTLLAHGITPFAGNKGYGLSVPVMGMSLAAIYQSADRDRLLQDLATGKTPISTYARQGFAFIQLMCDRGYLDPQQVMNSLPRSPEEVTLFTDGQAACVCALMGTANYCDPAETGFTVKMTGWPLLPDGEIAVVGTDQKLCANPASKHLDIVTAFIEMAGTKDALMQCTQDGMVSSGKVNDPAKYRENEKEFDALIQSPGQVPNTDMNLKINLWEYVRDISRLIVSGEVTVDEACRLLDEKQQQDIAANAKAAEAAQQ